MNDVVNILAIETSCDDTAAAVVQNNKVLSNIVSSQKIHELYGGVVPEVASREHDKLIVPVVSKALTSSGLSLSQINAVAYTRGPGLMGSLLVGTSFAKSLSLSLNVPLLDINHMHAHILSIFIDDGKDIPTFPFLALTVSGGHTQLVIVNSASDFNLIGTTLDDAAGEAFDKSGKLLGFEYPAGPKIDKIANDGDPNKFTFTKPNVAGLDFSFSGLKTNFKNFILSKDKSFIEDNLNDICASLQMTIIDILIDKIKVASAKFEINQIVVCGGVSANSKLRSELKALENEQIKTYVPELQYSTDNAAMIGISGYYKFLNSNFGNLSDQSTAKYPLS
jgi:N6-L-threonylcarbamoyladenine synthase